MALSNYRGAFNPDINWGNPYGRRATYSTPRSTLVDSGASPSPLEAISSEGGNAGLGDTGVGSGVGGSGMGPGSSPSGLGSTAGSIAGGIVGYGLGALTGSPIAATIGSNIANPAVSRGEVTAKDALSALGKGLLSATPLGRGVLSVMSIYSMLSGLLGPKSEEDATPEAQSAAQAQAEMANMGYDQSGTYGGSFASPNTDESGTYGGTFGGWGEQTAADESGTYGGSFASPNTDESGTYGGSFASPNTDESGTYGGTFGGDDSPGDAAAADAAGASAAGAQDGMGWSKGGLACISRIKRK